MRIKNHTTHNCAHEAVLHSPPWPTRLESSTQDGRVREEVLPCVSVVPRRACGAGASSSVQLHPTERPRAARGRRRTRRTHSRDDSGARPRTASPREKPSRTPSIPKRPHGRTDLVRTPRPPSTHTAPLAPSAHAPISEEREAGQGEGGLRGRVSDRGMVDGSLTCPPSCRRTR